MSVREPTAQTLNDPVVRYLLATRPPFLLASLVPSFIGLATAFYDGVSVHGGYAVLTVMGALLIHAGVNVLNDYYDALIGTDAMNTERIYPFTGGSRFIQNGLFSPRQMAVYGARLLFSGALIGMWLTFVSGPGLWLIGMTGIFLGWAYSAPPFSLNSRGWGELSVAVGFGLLIPLGADYVQRGAFSWLPVVAGLPYALLVANLLYINQFPDRNADAVSGKRHWVVRLGPQRARWGYGLIAGVAYGFLIGVVVYGSLPVMALLAIIPGLLSLTAAHQLIRLASAPHRLGPAIVLTIVAALSHGLILSAVLAWV